MEFIFFIFTLVNYIEGHQPICANGESRCRFSKLSNDFYLYINLLIMKFTFYGVYSFNIVLLYVVMSMLVYSTDL